MREKKYKLWDTNREEWMYLEFNVFINPKTGMAIEDVDNSCTDPECCGGPCPMWMDLEYVEVVQWTGLKDINGIDIYEGDIVKNIDGDVDVVMFEEYCYKLKNDTTGFSKLRIEDWKWEVIGNTFEDNKLISKK